LAAEQVERRFAAVLAADVAGTAASWVPTRTARWHCSSPPSPPIFPCKPPIRARVAINLAATKAPGIEIAPTLLARADRVIE
jgi:hypothetical protein